MELNEEDAMRLVGLGLFTMVLFPGTALAQDTCSGQCERVHTTCVDACGYFDCEEKGSVANLAIAKAMSAEASGSGRCGEQSSNEITLGLHVIRWCGQHLALADHRHGLVTGDRVGCRHEALEAQSWPN
jgi:hypothetical protein